MLLPLASITLSENWQSNELQSSKVRNAHRINRINSSGSRKKFLKHLPRSHFPEI